VLKKARMLISKIRAHHRIFKFRRRVFIVVKQSSLIRVWLGMIVQRRGPVLENGKRMVALAMYVMAIQIANFPGSQLNKIFIRIVYAYLKNC